MSKPTKPPEAERKPGHRETEMRALSEQLATLSIDALFAARRVAELAKETR